MFNVTVIRLRDLIKYPVVIIISFCLIYFSTRYFFNDENINEEKINVGEKIKNSLSKYLLYPLETSLPIIDNVNQENVSNKDNEINKDEMDFNTFLMNTIFKLQLGVTNEKR